MRARAGVSALINAVACAVLLRGLYLLPRDRRIDPDYGGSSSITRSVYWPAIGLTSATVLILLLCLVSYAGAYAAHFVTLTTAALGAWFLFRPDVVDYIPG